MSKTTTTNNIELNISSKKEYTINGDKEKVIKLNPNDMGIVARTSDAIAMINELEEKYRKLFTSEEPTDDELATFTAQFKEIDAGLREAVNFLFDYDVCSVCAGDGSMLDPQDGEYRYAVIINTLMTLYQDTISRETDKLIATMKKKVDKYVNNDHKRKRTK